jgi:hypothetical protein
VALTVLLSAVFVAQPFLDRTDERRLFRVLRQEAWALSELSDTLGPARGDVLLSAEGGDDYFAPLYEALDGVRHRRRAVGGRGWSLVVERPDGGYAACVADQTRYWAWRSSRPPDDLGRVDACGIRAGGRWSTWKRAGL